MTARSVGKIPMKAGILDLEVHVARKFAMSSSSFECCNAEVTPFGRSLLEVSGGLVGLAAAGSSWLSGAVGGKVGPVAAAGIPVLSVVRYSVGCITSDGRSLLGVISGTLAFVTAVGIGGGTVGLFVGKGWSVCDVDCGLQTSVTNGVRMSNAGSVNSLKKSLGSTNGGRSLGTLI